MSEYRVYYLDHSDHVTHAADIEASDDGAARSVAQAHARTGPIEIWRLDRFLCRFAPLGAAHPRLSARGR